ncbi:hypothetical protein [Roseimaritima ulvae]|uniref:Uncharacterized protein n=1 Tax=Roseimaritima ulvae TaxID=980254 RepID=A0A5B9QL84_9BACT|nr:hypothetical protein [Roseimaritima ulvae]QEG39694.1 hypothetical protein UC8_16900 [Roseimaritima ulvae]
MRSLLFAIVWSLHLLLLPYAVSQDGEREDGWLNQHNPDTGTTLRSKQLTLHRQSEPEPALRYRFLPNAFEAVPGNAALYYLKAMGFLEQTSARDRITEIYQTASEQANEQGQSMADIPPHVWLSTPPQQLPIDEVKDFLHLTSFQVPMLKEAAARSDFHLDRNLRDVEDLIAYLLPEIQTMRELARLNSMRCRLAVAENRIDDAIEICGQQFALARHLGKDDFLVCNLVGVAIGSIGWNDLLYVVQHPDAPNLYWALAALPDPLVDNRRAMAIEHQLLYLQLPALKEVSVEPRSAEYWQVFLDRLAAEPNSLYTEFGWDASDAETRRAMMVAGIAASYPSAKKYLIDVVALPPEQVEAYPTAQVVLLAMVKFYDHWRDEYFKWEHVPFWQRHTTPDGADRSSRLSAAAKQAGWFALPADTLIPLLGSIDTTEVRLQQQIALLQTVESIRAYAAAHGGDLPASLQDLELPAPVDPHTGQPLRYERNADHAVLTGQTNRSIETRLIVRIAP